MLVYSYIRFSSKQQADGDSKRRQREDGDKWIKRNAFTKANLSFEDLGCSAFRGKNKHSGALSRFLLEIKEGRIQRGSILLVEALDRLSRQGVAEAQALFLQILSAGVKIAVLKPSETIYSQESVNDLTGLLLPLVHFHLAYVESKHKSNRTGGFWEGRRAEVASGKVARFDRRKPVWVDWTTEGGFILNKWATAIRFIYEKTVEGTGQREMARLLNEKFPGRNWNSSMVHFVLGHRQVLGERQPFKFNEDGDRIPVGEPIKGYYPPVLATKDGKPDEALWLRAQHAKKINLKAKGPNADFVSLTKGLVVCMSDGHTSRSS
ncbi:MAG: recombinase family protein [Gemmataceae bacterium]